MLETFFLLYKIKKFERNKMFTVFFVNKKKCSNFEQKKSSKFLTPLIFMWQGGVKQNQVVNTTFFFLGGWGADRTFGNLPPKAPPKDNYRQGFFQKNSKSFQTEIPDKEKWENPKPFETGIPDRDFFKKIQSLWRPAPHRNSRQGFFQKNPKSFQTRIPDRKT